MIKHSLVIFALVSGITILLSSCGKSDSSGSGNSMREALNKSVKCHAPRDHETNESTSAELCKKSGSLVITQSNDLYRVDEIYSDGRADVRGYYNRDYTYTLPASTYWPEVYSIDGYDITEGSPSVITTNLDRYKVEAVFANGRVRVLSFYTSDSRTIVDIRDLSTEVPSYGAFAPGQLVIDHSNNHYKIISTYSNGELFVASIYNGSKTSFVKASDVATTISH